MTLRRQQKTPQKIAAYSKRNIDFAPARGTGSPTSRAASRASQSSRCEGTGSPRLPKPTLFLACENPSSAAWLGNKSVMSDVTQQTGPTCCGHTANASPVERYTPKQIPLLWLHRKKKLSFASCPANMVFGVWCEGKRQFG